MITTWELLIVFVIGAMFGMGLGVLGTVLVERRAARKHWVKEYKAEEDRLAKIIRGHQ